MSSSRVKSLIFSFASAGLVVITTLFLWQGLKTQETKYLKETAQEELVKFEGLISTELIKTLNTVEQVAERWNIRGGIPQMEWNADARAQIDVFTGMEAMFLLDRSMSLRWLVASDDLEISLEKFQKIIALKIDVLKTVSTEKKESIVESFLFNDTQVLWVLSPIYLDNQFDGFLVAFSRMESFLDFILLGIMRNDFSLSVLQDEEVIYGSRYQDIEFVENWSFVKQITLLDLKWTLSLVPNKIFFEKESSPLPILIICFGTVTGILIFVVIFFAIESRSQSIEIKSKNDLLNNSVSELKKITEELNAISRTDPLTLLSNRRGVLEKCNNEQLRLRRYDIAYSMILCDLDFFKKVNDENGHDAGDYILVNVAKILKGSVRSIDDVSRWGGEEFLIILPESGLEGAKKVGEKIRASIESSVFNFAGKELKITMSLGVVCHSNKENNFEELIKIADEFLYKAKESGRNIVIDE
mgnify:CR=1 FL=1